MVQLRTILPTDGSAGPVRPARVRPLLGPDLASADGRADLVVVDELLRGNPVPHNRWELREALRVVYELRLEFHGEHSVMPGRRFNDRSPYRQILSQLAEALGDSPAEIQARIRRYGNARTLADRRAAMKEAERERRDGD